MSFGWVYEGLTTSRMHRSPPRLALERHALLQRSSSTLSAIMPP